MYRNVWENEELTQQQLRYAATDAYASLPIYEALAKRHAPCSLPDDAHPLTPVLLYDDNRKTIIAVGQLSPHMNDRSLDSIITFANSYRYYPVVSARCNSLFAVRTTDSSKSRARLTTEL